MANTRFMQQKYSVQELISKFLEDIKPLQKHVQTPADETKLQLYYQAASTFKRASVKDWVQFALSWGRSQSGMSPQIRQAFPMFLGNRISHASQVDLAYLEVLLAYMKAFKKYRGNMKDWMLRFVINSRFSPLHGFFERELNEAIEQTSLKITGLKARYGYGY